MDHSLYMACVGLLMDRGYMPRPNGPRGAVAFWNGVQGEQGKTVCLKPYTKEMRFGTDEWAKLDYIALRNYA